ncbi:MAG: M1 family metallopeptidase [Gammaproteobacteria bacterium]|nr:M1 family metallopeptidase [Gammaproteobacteria bacterium]
MRFVASLLLLLIAVVSFAESLPDSNISYTIEVRLDPATRDLDGRATIRWRNALDREVDSVPMHLYLNAFSNRGSSWFSSTLGERFLESTILERFDDPWGWTEPESIRQDGAELEWRPIAPDDGNHLDRSLIEVALLEPVPPGETVTLEVDWSGRLPAAAARTGGYDRFFFIAQWFPKIAGLRPEGDFNRHQFFGPTEFFANFADYDVTIGIPNGWGIAATGRGELLRSDDELDWHRYRQDAVIDFALAVGAGMENVATTHELATGGTVDIHIFQPQGYAHQVARWTDATARSLDTMSVRVMPYPYATVTVVLPPRAGTRAIGMEYPTLFTGGPGGGVWDRAVVRDTRINEAIIAHEFAHQYFNAVVATNEFEDAFMDEGMTEYWAAEIMAEQWGEASGMGLLFGRPLDVNTSSIASKLPTSVYPAVWSGPSFLARGYSIGRQFYDRPAVTFQTAARLFGQDVIDRVFATYTQRWQFRHPRVEDFWAVAEEVGGPEVAAMLREAYQRPGIPDYKVASIKVRKYVPPPGYLGQGDDRVLVGLDWDGDEEFGLPAEALEEDGRVLVRVLDPGHTRETRTMGNIELRFIDAVGDTGDDDSEERTFYKSVARVTGPDWDHLPVTVELRFADGVVIRDDWDGKGLYREYSTLRPSPLEAVVIDPDYNIRVDIVPVNNGLSDEASGDVPGEWARWVTALYQLFAEGAASWL